MAKSLPNEDGSIGSARDCEDEKDKHEDEGLKEDFITLGSLASCDSVENALGPNEDTPGTGPLVQKAVTNRGEEEREK